MSLFRRKPRQMTLPGLSVPREGPFAKARPGHRRPGPIRRARLILVSAPVTRRRFLSGTLGWVTAAIAAALGVPAVVAAVSPALRKEQRGWSPIGKLGDPDPGEPDLAEEGKPMLTHFTALVEDAYLSAQPQNVPVFVVNRGDGQFTVFDVRCTHLGCPISWKEDEQEFLSPCHGGVFDAEGRVLAGPPPRPLDRYEFRVGDGVLYAGRLYRVSDNLERITP